MVLVFGRTGGNHCAGYLPNGRAVQAVCMMMILFAGLLSRGRASAGRGSLSYEVSPRVLNKKPVRFLRVNPSVGRVYLHHKHRRERERKRERKREHVFRST